MWLGCLGYDLGMTCSTCLPVRSWGSHALFILIKCSLLLSSRNSKP